MALASDIGRAASGADSTPGGLRREEKKPGHKPGFVFARIEARVMVEFGAASNSLVARLAFF
jgi:hypothetical protein